MPPVDAFDNLPQRRPPNLPGYEQDRQQAAQQAAGNQKKKKPKAGKAPRQEVPQKATGRQGGKPEKAGEKQDKGRKKPPAPQKQANPAKRRRRRRVMAVLAIALFIGVGIWLSVTLLFKIQKYDVAGDSPYTVEQLADAFGHPVGDNMYGFVAENAAERITTTLPYVESVKIRRRLPSTIVFEVTTAEERYYLPWEDGYAVLSASQKVLRTTTELPQGLVRIEGLSGIQVQPGHPLQLTEEAQRAASASAESESAVAGASSSQLASSSAPATGTSEVLTGTGTVDSTPPAGEGDAGDAQPPEGGQSTGEDGSQGMDEAGDGQSAPQSTTPPPAAPEAVPATAAESFAVLQQLLVALEEAELHEITWVNVADPLNLRFGWQDRVTVLLGAKGNLADKLDTVWVLLCDEERRQVESTEKGTLDMTYHAATGRVYFRRE